MGFLYDVAVWLKQQWYEVFVSDNQRYNVEGWLGIRMEVDVRLSNDTFYKCVKDENGLRHVTMFTKQYTYDIEERYIRGRFFGHVHPVIVGVTQNFSPEDEKEIAANGVPAESKGLFGEYMKMTRESSESKGLPDPTNPMRILDYATDGYVLPKIDNLYSILRKAINEADKRCNPTQSR